MKITLEFTNIENFFTELPRFAALMNFSGQFASFDHVKKSELVSNLEEPILPEANRGHSENTTRIAGTPEQLDKVNAAGDIADKTVDMIDKKKKEAAAKKTAKKKAEEEAQESQDAPEEDQAANSTPEEEKPAQKPAAAASGAVKDTDVRKVLNKLIKSGHREEVKTILAEFGAPNFSKLDERHFAAVIEKAKEVLGNDSE